jgi:hypothetical protein
MAYRNDLDALAARLTHLHAEVLARTRERDELARLVSDARAEEQAETNLVRARLYGKRRDALLVVLALLALVSICALGAAVKPMFAFDFVDDPIADYEAFADAMCACRDAACVHRVDGEITAWAAVEQPRDVLRPWSRADGQYLNLLGRQVAACMERRLAPRPRPERVTD